MTFRHHWLQLKIEPELSNLNQRQLEALRKMMNRAYETGHRHATKGKTA